MAESLGSASGQVTEIIASFEFEYQIADIRNSLSLSGRCAAGI